MSQTTTPPELDTHTPLFEPFEWVARAHQTGPYDLLSDVRDLAAGAGVIMAMIEQSDIDVDNGEAPLFTPFNRGRLLRMSIAAMNTIDVQVERYFDRMSKDGEKLRVSTGRNAP